MKSGIFFKVFFSFSLMQNQLRETYVDAIETFNLEMVLRFFVAVVAYFCLVISPYVRFDYFFIFLRP